MTDETRISLRLPRELAAVLRQRAAADHRSLNKEIIFLLEQATYSVVEADAFRETRRRLLADMPRLSMSRPVKRRPRQNGGATS